MPSRGYSQLPQQQHPADHLAGGSQGLNAVQLTNGLSQMQQHQHQGGDGMNFSPNPDHAPHSVTGGTGELLNRGGGGGGGATPADARRTYVVSDMEAAKLRYAGQEQCLFKYDLVSIDALAMRNRHIILDIDRVNLLGLARIRCHNDACYTPTWVSMKVVTDQSFKHKLVCRGCDRCLQCGKSSDECDKIGKHKKAWHVPWWRTILRVVWHWVTIFGTLVKVYKLLMRNIFYTVLFAYTASLFQTELDVVKTTVLTSSHDASWSAWFSEILAGVGKNIAQWAWTLVVVVALACVLMMIKLLESFYVVTFHEFVPRIKRLRFDRIELNATQEEEHAKSYANEYFSDDEREGYNDPDIAYMNLSMQDTRGCLRRSRRWCCFRAMK